MRKIQKISFAGESRHDKDIFKKKSYIFYQKDPSSTIKFIKVENLSLILHQDPENIIIDSNFMLINNLQGIMFTPLKYDCKSSWMYFEWLKYLNKAETLIFPLIVIPNQNINKASWKFTSKNPHINKIYAKKLNIRISDNLPIFLWSTLILTPNNESKGTNIVSSELASKFDKTCFKIYDVISKINKNTEISLSLEIYQSISSLK